MYPPGIHPLYWALSRKPLRAQTCRSPRSPLVSSTGFREHDRAGVAKQRQIGKSCHLNNFRVVDKAFRAAGPECRLRT